MVRFFSNPSLVKILAYADQKGVAITLANGVNLNHARDEVLEALVKYRVRAVRCSIDGASPETYRGSIESGVISIWLSAISNASITTSANINRYCLAFSGNSLYSGTMSTRFRLRARWRRI